MHIKNIMNPPKHSKKDEAEVDFPSASFLFEFSRSTFKWCRSYFVVPEAAPLKMEWENSSKNKYNKIYFVFYQINVFTV